MGGIRFALTPLDKSRVTDGGIVPWKGELCMIVSFGRTAPLVTQKRGKAHVSFKTGLGRDSHGLTIQKLNQGRLLSFTDVRIASKRPM